MFLIFLKFVFTNIEEGDRSEESLFSMLHRCFCTIIVDFGCVFDFVLSLGPTILTSIDTIYLAQ